jgi:hypothetical protein
MTLDDIVDQLDQHGQRATYGAGAHLLGHSPRSLLKGRERERRFSWIVNHNTGRPTGYADAQIDPRLPASGAVIADSSELQRWLSSSK